MRFSMIWRYHFVQCVPVRISPVAVPVAVHSWPSTRARDEVSGVGWRMTEVGVELILQGPQSAIVARHKATVSASSASGGPYSCVSLPLGGGSGRSHKETWAGCIVSLTTPTSSSLRAPKLVSSRNLAEKPSSVFLASYFRR
jgi:hypothetical protein